MFPALLHPLLLGQGSNLLSEEAAPVLQACPCTPSTIFQGNWDYGEPGMADGRGILDRQNNQFINRPGDWNSPYQGWWYMIHGGASAPQSSAPCMQQYTDYVG